MIHRITYARYYRQRSPLHDVGPDCRHDTASKAKTATEASNRPDVPQAKTGLPAAACSVCCVHVNCRQLQRLFLRPILFARAAPGYFKNKRLPLFILTFSRISTRCSNSTSIRDIPKIL